MPSNDTRDGWAVKGPDGRLYVGTAMPIKFWRLSGIPRAERRRIGGDPIDMEARIESAKRLGYSLVPVRLVEIEQPEREGGE